MKSIKTLAVALLISGSALAQNFEQIVGNWEGTFDGATLIENWHKKDAETFIAEGWVIAGPDTFVTEVLRIQRIAGHWTYIPSINGGHPVLFTMVEHDKSKMVFENKEHDFPQRVVYSFPDAGSMTAWIEGEENGKVKKEVYPYKRAK